MDVKYFFRLRTDLLRHFYDSASAPFIEAKRCIDEGLPPFDEPPYDESGEPAFLIEWLRADVEHQMVGRAAISVLSDSLKQFFAAWEKALWWVEPRSKAVEAAFKKEGFISGYVELFGQAASIDWSKCPADLEVLKQVVLARNHAQHGHLTHDHLPHSEKALKAHPNPYFIQEDYDGLDFSSVRLLSPSVHIGREKLMEAVLQAEALADWLDFELRAAEPQTRHKT